MDADARQWKPRMRARLAAARSSLLVQLLGLADTTLENELVGEGLTAAQVLSLTGSEDEIRAGAMERVLAGDDPESSLPEPHPPPVASFSDALKHLLRTRKALLSALARLPDEDLFRALGDDGPTVAGWIEECLAHDELSADRLAEWRSGRRQAAEIGPRDLLLSSIRAARKEVLSEIALITEPERPSWTVGTRSLQSALDELCRWEEQLLTALAGTDVATAGGGWSTTWRRLHDTHHALVRLVEAMPEQDLARPLAGPWRGERTLYDLLCSAAMQGRQVAAALRTSREVSPSASRAAP